jgi:hypothetical protein
MGEVYGQERAPGAERPERPTERPPTPPVSSGAVPRDTVASRLGYTPEQEAAAQAELRETRPFAERIAERMTEPLPAWESLPREPMPDDLADMVLSNLRREVNDALVGLDIEALARDAVEGDAANNRTIEALKRQGVLVGPEVIIMARVATLATVLLGDANGDKRTAARLQYEQRCNTEIANVLEQVRSQVARAKLTTNIHMPPNGGGLPRG